MAQPEPVSWTVHLAAERPGRAVAVAVFIVLGVSAVALLVPPSWGFGTRVVFILLALFLLLGSIAEFLFPVTYTLDARGAHVRYPGSYRVLAWQQVRRVYLRPDGIKLSPLTTRGLAEQYRGVMLRTHERDVTLAQVRAWLQEAGVEAEVVES